MKVIIDVPNYEFNNDVKDKFQDYFNRIRVDIADGTVCGNYELETTEMFLASFKRMQILPDNATNGDMIKAMFPNMQIDNECNGILYGYKTNDREMPMLGMNLDWWNAPYKKDCIPSEYDYLEDIELRNMQMHR